MASHLKIHGIHFLWLSLCLCWTIGKVCADETAPDSTFTSGQEQQLAKVELSLFGHTFPSDSSSGRLSRVEELVFGDESGGDGSIRLTKIILALAKNKPSEIKKVQTSNKNSLAANANIQESFDSAMRNGSADFEAKRFHSAQNHFEQAIKTRPQSAKAYALLGDTLYHLSDREGARAAYKACFMVDPFGEYSNYAKNYLLKLTNDDTAEDTSPQDKPETVSRTVALINRQAADAARRYLSRGDIYARYRINLGNIEIAKINDSTAALRSDINAGVYGLGYNAYGGVNPPPGYGNAYGNGYAGGYGNGYGGGYYPANYNNRNRRRRDEISDLDYIRSNYIRTDSIVQANRYRIEAAEKAAAIQESAANLKDQMLQPVRPGGAQLRALGTSLYARYYGNGLPSAEDAVPEDPPVPALTAIAKEIGSPGKIRR